MTDSARENREIVQGLKEILVKNLDLSLEAGEIADDASLLEDGLGLDSVVIVELITHVEKRFGLQFDDQHLRTENFESLKTLAELVATERAATAA